MSRFFCEIVKNNRVVVVGNILNSRSFSGSANNPANDSKQYDIVIVGGGIVGAATARELKERHANLRMAIVEKEKDLAMHQTGHNSGVIHAGMYYTPGSLKAKLCVEGLQLSYKYCDSKGIPYKKVGKLIVATTPIEVERLHVILEKGTKNKVPDMKLLKGEKAIKEIEPQCTGIEALWSPHTGIIDWAVVCKHYGRDFKETGGDIWLNFEVNGFRESGSADYPVLITSKSGKSINSKYVLTCGGLQSDMLAELSGCPKSPRIVPFRGEYLLLDAKKASTIKGNIYPVPDPRFPFLGVHFTPRMNGDMWLGPNAVLAFKREGYRWSDINIKEFIDAVMYPGFLKLAFKFALPGMQEIAKSFYTPWQVKELQKFVPSVTPADVKRGPAGVRAQAVSSDGNLVDDFYFDMNMNKGKKGTAVGDRILHCRNAPSPGATSSLAIAKMMADKLEQEFKLK